MLISVKYTFAVITPLLDIREARALQCNCFRQCVTGAAAAGVLQSINRLLHDVALAV